ncbi:MAG: TraR/DksA C4-type zinc finger protein [Pseudomonadota bacterium]|nr:TraR/DksA C4-type zinc finger protein [Pseudomonadota bacterium]
MTVTKDENLLTEKELLEMSDDDYMGKQQRMFFKDMLVKMQEDLKKDINEARNSMLASGEVGDSLDLASDADILQINLRTTERKTKLLHKVEEALIRVDNGTYGYCVESGYPIGIKRLLARPTATLSIDSKEQQEFHERTEGVSDIGDEKDEDAK